MAIVATNDYIESWVVIKDFPNYSISDSGNVVNNKTRRVLSKNINSSGYFSVSLCVNSRSYSKYVHRLVAYYFVLNKNKDCVVNHIDGDKLNNHFDNLEWTTITNNNKHYHQLLSKQYGEGSCKSKISNLEALKIRQLGKELKNAREVSRQLGIRYPICYRVISGRSFKKVY